jgi:hypothetical protein
MTPTKIRNRAIIYRVAALLLTLLSAFFVFYTARLFYVTHGLRTIRAGGQGTYIGAIVFPVLAILLGFGAWRLIRIARHA